MPDSREAHFGMTYPCCCRTVLAGAALAAISLAGCGGGVPVNTGPFGGSNYIGESTCSVPLAPYSVFTDSDLAFTNSGTTTAVIGKVSFTHIDGLRLLAAYAVPNTGQGGGYGDRMGYPPPQRDLPPGVLWSRRQRADGARIPPTPPKPAEVDLVLVIQLTGASGTFSGIDLYYHTSDGQYHMHVDRSLTLRTKNGQSCRSPNT
jgi:hypothetical protein